MKKVLKNNKRTQKYFKKLKPVYLICYWSKYGYRDYPYVKTNKDGIPLVYEYCDGNGTLDEYHLMEITEVTTGIIYFWTFSERVAKKIVDALNFSKNNII